MVGSNRTEVVYRAPSSGNCSITHLETLIMISFLIPADISHFKPFSSTCSTRRADIFAKHSITREGEANSSILNICDLAGKLGEEWTPKQKL